MEKLYPFIRVTGVIILLSAGVLACVISIVYHDIALFCFFVFMTCIFLSMLLSWIVEKQFIPLYIDEKGLQYRGKIMDWDKIKITVYQKYRYDKVIIFDSRYITDRKELNKKLRCGCRLYVYKDYLNIVTKYCNSPIWIYNKNNVGDAELYFTPRIFNKIIYDHNKKFENIDKEENVTILVKQSEKPQSKNKTSNILIALFGLLCAIVFAGGAVLMRLGFLIIGAVMSAIASVGIIISVIWKIKRNRD